MTECKAAVGKHYRRQHKHGSPDRLKSTPWGAPSQFLHEVVLTYEGDKCLIWPFSRTGRGYGEIRLRRPGRLIQGKRHVVSRLVCTLTYGPPPTKAHKATFSCTGASAGCCAKRHLSWQKP